MSFNEIQKPIEFIFQNKPTQLQNGDFVKFSVQNNTKKFVYFIRKSSHEQENHTLFKNQIFFDFEQSEEIMSLIMAGRNLGFKLFKKELNKHVYILTGYK